MPKEEGQVAAGRARGGDVFVLPPSFAQERMWFLDRLFGESAAYNMPVALRLQGALDVRALTRALAGVVRRHEVLRTTLPTLRGELVQVVRPAAPAAWPLVDLSALGGEARAREEGRLRRGEAARRFDLARGPLLRALLVRMAAGDHVALCTMHHAVADGWSRGVLARELGAGYAAALEGRPSPLPPPGLQYGDFAAWQRKWLEGDACRRQLAYWRDKLAGAPPALELPSDRPRGGAQDPRGGSVPVRFPEGLGPAVRELCRREGATPMMAFLAAFKVVLARWTGETDVVVGTPVAGRNRRELEELVGLFVNTLALRTELDGAAGFRGVLRRVRATTVEAQAAQDVPFERVVEEVRPETEPGRNPLFDVMLSFAAPPRETMSLGGLTLTSLALEVRAAHFELALFLTDHPEGPAGALAYRTALFETATMERLAGHLARLLEGAVAAPDAPWTSLPLMGEAETRRVRDEWSTGGSAAPAPRCVHELFAEQAERRPDAVALVHGEEEVTYAELHRRSDALAHALVARGVGPDVRVGVCVERSPELVVGLLGILKAGGAYVPLDPGYPAERLAYMLEDAGVPVLLTQERLVERLPEFGGAVVLLDVEEEGAAAAPGARVTPDHLAYVIYTSGSTGQPKGTEVPHRAIPGFFRGVDYARFDEGTVLLQHSSTSWDALTLELWPALLSGGRCVLYPGAASEPAVLGEQLRRHGANTLWLTSAYFNLIVDSCPEILRGVAQVMTGGEAVSIPHVRRALELYPELRLVNGYGPSECTVFATCWPVPAGFDAPVLPIGRPVGDRRVHLLDRWLEAVPAGVPGEVCVGGPAVARGYLGRPELTAERFVPDPYSGEPGARMYRSGDRARWRADGVLEFVGRTDFQVKIRGFRVEPGEVEAVLAADPEVREAAVAVREDAPGERRLVAYLVGGDGLDPAAVRARVRGRLPEYMLPSAWVVLDALPLTPHGKTDRAALPAPDGDTGGGEPLHVAPRDPVEELAAGFWAEVLKRESVGVHDDLFALGASSLGVMRVAARLRAALGVEVPVRVFFTRPTVAGVAEWVREARGGGAGGHVPIPRADRSGPLPLSFAQERLWFTDQAEDTGAAYTISLAFRLEGAPVDAPALARAFAAVAGRHEVLRTVLPGDGGRPRQAVLPPAPFPLPLVELRGLPAGAREAEARRAIAVRSGLRFDLERGPLLRALLLRTGDEEHLLALDVHHVAFDGWSVGVLLRELTACYEAARSGREPHLPELPVQYADFAAWQREWLAGEGAAEQLAYWKRRLADLPALDLSPGPRPARAGYRGAGLPLRLGPELSARVRAAARERQATPFMFLLAAFKVVLASRAGTRDVVVGTDLAGRARAETEPLVGFFVNEVVLRTPLSGDPAFTELLGRVRETTLDAYAHQDLPFALVVRETAGRRDLGATPLFQVMFGMDNTPSEAPAADGLRVSRVESGSAVSPWELSLYLREGAQGITGAFRFRTDLFDAATVEALRADYLWVLEAVCERPDARVEELVERLGAAALARRVGRGQAAEDAAGARLRGVRRQPVRAGSPRP